VCGQSDRPPYPQRLKDFLGGNRAQTSQVEWTVAWIGRSNDGLVERNITRSSGDTIWQTNLGDENGYHTRALRDSLPGEYDEKQQMHEVPQGEQHGTHSAMLYDGQLWQLHDAERPISGIVLPPTDRKAFAPIDPLTMGLTPYWGGPAGKASPFQLPDDAAEAFASAKFTAENAQGQPTLSALFGDFRLTWTFDDTRGGQPIRAELYRGDALWYYSESESELHQANGRWLPESVRFYTHSSATPYKVVDVQRATFDEPWHMQEITPTDIGAVDGTRFATPTEMKFWMGAELIDEEQFGDMVHVFGILPDPMLLELTAKAVGLTVDQFLDHLRRNGEPVRAAYKKKYGEEPWLVKKSPKEKDEWDLYLEEFLAKHKLPELGIKRANEIRDQSKKLRDAYRRKNAAALRKAKEENDSRKVAEYEGIEKRIFDRVLVRDLKRLLPDEKDAPKKNP